MKLHILNTSTHDPYLNLAREEHLLSLAGDDILLYLWQNAHTVVIGQHQNALRDVNLAQLRMDGGHLTRRLSGGGAVYHDLGNLNFTLVVPRARYDLTRQTRVILEAARIIGLPAEASGRNDITLYGQKFSGNAYYRRGETWYHHGTLLIDSDLEALGRYLNVSAEKLRARGVASVRSRVCNLRDYAPHLTIEAMRRAMEEAFSRVYGASVQPLDVGRLDEGWIRRRSAEIASDEYLLGSAMPLDIRLERRFPWGEIQLALAIEGGRITRAQAYSDAMDEEAIERLPALIEGCPVDGRALREALCPLGDAAMAEDVLSLLLTL